MYNLNQARQLITALTGSDCSNITFQTFYDPKTGDKRKELADIWTASLDDSIEYIDWKQSQMCGIYITVNETDSKGRETSNITRVRGVFCDFDGMVEPNWVLAPHIVQKRDDTHGHAIWLIDDCEVSQFAETQYLTALYYGSDKQVCDPARVFRLAGTVHYKDPQNPSCYYVTVDNTQSLPKYTRQQFIDHHCLPADKQAELTEWIEKRNGIDTGVGYVHMSSDVQHVTNFLKNAAHPAVDGQGGTHELFRVAATGHDYGIPLADMQQLMWENYNPRCEPQWGEHERDHFNDVVKRGYHYATNAPGCKSSISVFTEAILSLPEPVGGWGIQGPLESPKPEYADGTITPLWSNDTPVTTVTQPTGRGLRLSHDEAVSLQAISTVKSSHYDFARIVDGLMFDGCGLIRHKKVFYMFGGKVWREVTDDVVKHYVLCVLSVYSPPNSMLNGVYSLLESLVTVDSLNENVPDGENNVVFQNGIVDINNPNPVIKPHSHEFFTTTELPYDYDVTAQCPTWLRFLDDVFGNDDVTKRSLQQSIGYCLTDHNRYQKMFALVGKSRAGKGVITDTIAEIVGRTNISAPSLENLNNNSTLEAMSKSSVALIPDAHSVNNSQSNAIVSKLKQISGYDDIDFHVMYKGSRSQKFHCKPFISTNNFPEFNDPSGALVNRMIVFYFTRSFKGREDPMLRDKIKAEIAGVTQWAIAGLRDLISHNGRFVESKMSLDEKEEIKNSMSPLSPFINAQCNVGENNYTSITELYGNYRVWLSTDGAKFNMTMSKFRRTLRTSDLDITIMPDGMVKGLSVNNMLTVQSA